MIFKGFFLGLSLIVAIGAQNAHVLKVALKGQHALKVGTICFISDCILIWAGILGLGSIISSYPSFIPLMKYFAGAVLVIYALIHFHSALRGEGELRVEKGPHESFRGIALATLALTFFNPHVYLDTVILIGSSAARYSGNERLLFGVGACLASFIWFYSLSYFPGLFKEKLSSKKVWQAIDTSLGVLMLFLVYVVLK